MKIVIKPTFQILIAFLIFTPPLVTAGDLNSQLTLTATPTESTVDLSAHNAPHFRVDIQFTITNTAATLLKLEFDPARLAMVNIDGWVSKNYMQEVTLCPGANSIIEIAAGETVKLSGILYLRASSLFEKNQSYRLATTLYATVLAPKPQSNSMIELNSSFILSTH